jgi:hypothetical protein
MREVTRRQRSTTVEQRGLNPPFHSNPTRQSMVFFILDPGLKGHNKLAQGTRPGFRRHPPWVPKAPALGSEGTRRWFPDLVAPLQK